MISAETELSLYRDLKGHSLSDRVETMPTWYVWGVGVGDFIGWKEDFGNRRFHLQVSDLAVSRWKTSLRDV